MNVQGAEKESSLPVGRRIVEVVMLNGCSIGFVVEVMIVVSSH